MPHRPFEEPTILPSEAAVSPLEHTIVDFGKYLEQRRNQTSGSEEDATDQEPGSLIDFKQATRELYEKKARKHLPPPERTGSYKEALDRTAYVDLLTSIAKTPIESFHGPIEEISMHEKETLLTISLLRMKETDATPEQIEAQLNHLRDVYDMTIQGAYLVMSASLEQHPNNPRFVDLKALGRAALLHDTCKFCASFIPGESGNTRPSVVTSAADPAKPRTNPDLFGHNARSAVDSIAILQSILEAESSPSDRANLHAFRQAMSVDIGKAAHIILCHSTDEFPDELVSSLPPEMIETLVTDTTRGLTIENVRLTVWKSPFGDVCFVRLPPADIESAIMHSADLLVGAGTESYGKYLIQHVKDPVIAKGDKTTANERKWTIFQAAIKTCFDSSAKNYLYATIPEMRDQLGLERIARAQAYREFFDRTDQLPIDITTKESTKKLVDRISTANVTNPEDQSRAIEAYQQLLGMAETYCAKREQDPDFTQRYATQFLEEQTIMLENDLSYWQSEYNGGNERKRAFCIKQTTHLQKLLSDELTRLRTAAT